MIGSPSNSNHLLLGQQNHFITIRLQTSE